MAAWLSDCAIWAARYIPGQGWAQPEAIGGLPAGAPANWLWEPLLAVNDSGTALVIWATQVEVSEGRQLWARRWENATGWRPAERIDGSQSGQISTAFLPAVALDSAGNSLVVWISQGVVVAARFVAGAGWAPPERIGGPGAFVYQSASFDPLGRAFATWTEGGAAIVRRFEPGRGWSPAMRFAPQDDRTFVGAGLAFDSTGRSVLVWEQSLGYLRPSSVWSASFVSDAWTAFGQISGAGANAGNPQVGLGSDGRGLAVWSEIDGPRFASFDFARGWEAPAAISASPLGPLDLAVNGRGLGVMVWNELEASLEHAHVQTSRYVNGRWEASQPLQATSNPSGEPAIAIDHCGNAIAVWSEFEGGQTRVWANRFDTGCR